MRGSLSMSREATSVLARRDAQSKLIAATRDGGLGGRLLAMVNAKSLADTLGYRFSFAWEPIHDEELHSVEKVDRICRADFIEKHWLGEKANALFKRIQRHIRPLATPQSGPLAKARLWLWKAGIRVQATAVMTGCRLH